jgi:polygalacturonase
MRAVSNELLALFVLAIVATATAQARGIFSVRDHGAQGDGKTLDTAAILKAISACEAAGGGQVLFPPGKYLSATIRLKSHVTLKLEAGATLIGCPDPEAYHHLVPPPEMPEARFSSRWHRALILGDGLEDVTVIGPGSIDGNKVFDPKGEERRRGPHTILLSRCRDVTIRDLNIRDSANYAMFLEDCSQVDVRQVHVTGGWDGFHFRGSKTRPCKDVRITACQFFTGDDAIAGRYWEDVLITGCVLNSSCNAVRLIGPAKHLTIHDCLIYGPGKYEHRSGGRRNSLAGLSLQPGAWDATQGELDDVLISDITMRNVAVPFFFLLKPGNQGGRLTVERVSATGVYLTASSIESWAKAPFERVTFRDVSIEYAGSSSRKASGPIRSPGVDPRPLPAWGFYARGVKDLRFENVRLAAASDPGQPVFLMEDVGRLAFDGLRFPRRDTGSPPFVLTKVGKLETRDVDGPSDPPRQP